MARGKLIPVVPAMPALRMRALRWGMVGSLERVLRRVETERREVSSTSRECRWIREVAWRQVMWAVRVCEVERDLAGERVVKRRFRWEVGGEVERKSLIRRWQIPRPRPLGKGVSGMEGDVGG
jgi:hypothetical protein